MIEKIIAWSAKNRFFVFLGTIVAMGWGLWAVKTIPLDAIPDLSDVQAIVFTEWPGRSPDLVEDQITYPIVTSMIAAPKVKVARGYSFFGLSFVYIIFQDGTDMYWARSRVMEYMSKVRGKLPKGVNSTLGPDATGVGWVYQYALVDKTGQNSLADLRSFQDWYLRYWLESVPGVAEVAPLGGFVKQYQVEVDPDALVAYNISMNHVIHSIRRSNNDVGGRVLEISEAEHFVRGRGYIKSLSDIENIALKVTETGTPVLVKNVARVHFGPEMRRGVAELDGEGEVVGGIVVMRYGENALQVINRVKEKIEDIKGSLPPGVELVTTYDRSDLILRAIDTLKSKLSQQVLIVALLIILFLWHFRSSLLPIITLPLAVLFAFIPMKYLGLTSNIMSLGGIAIAIGTMVDASIVLIENAHKRISEWESGGRKGNRFDVLLKSSQEVGRPIFFSLLVIAVAFMPIFTLQAQEGRLFKPLAFTQNFSLFFAAILAITLIPALIPFFVKGGKIHPEKTHPVSKFLNRIYHPSLTLLLKWRKTTLITTLAVVLGTVPVFMNLGSEFMPPLNEGDILYMPTTFPGISIETSRQWLQRQDQVIKSFPEVERVFGKVGRARTPTDPAPLSMVETVVKLHPYEDWPKVHHHRWYSDWDESIVKKSLRLIWPEMKRRKWERLIEDMDKAMQMPGTTNAWIMPIKTRIDMLTTGIRTPVGIKIFGPDLKRIEKIGEHIEGVLPSVHGTRSVFAERVTGGRFIDFHIKREEIARYGLTVGDVEDIIESAIGGKNVTYTVEGRERYPVNVRYLRELRGDIDQLKRVLVPTPSGSHVPLQQLADVTVSAGPPAIKDENGMLTGWVYIDITSDRDIGSYVKEAKEKIKAEVKMPPGYSLSWSGQFEYKERAEKRLLIILPLTLFLIAFLLYLNTRSWLKTGFVFLAVPIAMVGAIWFLYILNFNMSIAVWVGLIALAGVATENGVIMLIYLDTSYQKRLKEGKIKTMGDMAEAVIEGASQRIRPITMTVGTDFLGLLPIMWAGLHQAGADVMKRIATPMVGGIITSFITVLFVFPVLFAVWKWNFEIKNKTQVKSE